MSGDDRPQFRPHAVELRHSTVTFEYGPAGVIARIDFHERPERCYAGPLPPETVTALAEVGE